MLCKDCWYDTGNLTGCKECHIWHTVTAIKPERRQQIFPVKDVPNTKGCMSIGQGCGWSCASGLLTDHYTGARKQQPAATASWSWPWWLHSKLAATSDLSAIVICTKGWSSAFHPTTLECVWNSTNWIADNSGKNNSDEILALWPQIKLNRGVLHYRWEDADRGASSFLLLVPTSLQTEVIS